MTSSNQKQLVASFYEAFVRKDADAMGALYADDATFSDEVFVGLNSKQAAAMWKMLSTRSKDLKVTFEILGESGDEVHTEWHAYYTFSKTGRMVHNVIQSTIKVKNNKIYSHRDSFSFWKWSTQALGPIGFILGWTPIIKGKVQKEAMASLHKFMA